MRLFIIISILLSSLIAFAGDKTTETFTLDHQMTGMCKKRITDHMRFEKGVSMIDISIPDNMITITFDPQKTDSEKLLIAFKKIGFNAILITPSVNEEGNKEIHQDEKDSAKEEENECCVTENPESGCCLFVETE
ncbi:MAG: hypothetical protein J1F67_08235 [Muribaculaceae bacterium]|nr:hypothetical protein [Muribaculaceae bacterium]